MPYYDELTCELWKGHFSLTGNEASSIRIGKTPEISDQSESTKQLIEESILNYSCHLSRGPLPREQWWLASSKLGLSNWKHEQLTGRLLFASIMPGKYSFSWNPLC